MKGVNGSGVTYFRLVVRSQEMDEQRKQHAEELVDGEVRLKNAQGKVKLCLWGEGGLVSVRR